MLPIIRSDVYLVVSALSVGCLTATRAQAQDLQTASTGEATVAEINGLVVDEAITKVGRDFYEVFYRQWEPPASEMSYTILIKELPLPGRGSQVMVYLNETELFSQPVQPRYDVIEETAEYAAGVARSYVMHYESISQQLGTEDQRGSGIF